MISYSALALRQRSFSPESKPQDRGRSTAEKLSAAARKSWKRRRQLMTEHPKAAAIRAAHGQKTVGALAEELRVAKPTIYGIWRAAGYKVRRYRVRNEGDVRVKLGADPLAT